ncbi:MAG: rhodanese-like domain-containing protein, partial [Desulfobacteraceae bacterium]
MIREAALVIIVALVLAGAGYMFRPAVMPTASDGTFANGGGEEESVIGVMPLESARRHFEQGTALFADARPERVYRFGHIPGAINLDPSEFDT